MLGSSFTPSKVSRRVGERMPQGNSGPFESAEYEGWTNGACGGQSPLKGVKLGMAIVLSSMVKNMRTSLLAIFVVLLIAAAACGESKEAEPEEDKAAPGGKPVVEQVDPDAAPLGLQAVIGEPIRIPGEVLPPPIGEPPLDGSIVITFKSVVRTKTFGTEAKALAGGASAAFYDTRHGTYLAVFYEVRNESTGVLKPSVHVNDAFELVDGQGRKWDKANYFSHGFEVPYAIAVPLDKGDPRTFVEPGETVEVAIAFDLALDATGLRLLSERLDLEIDLGE